MTQIDPATPPQPTAEGVLSAQPLWHLLAFARDQKLTGTFELADDPREYALVVVVDGNVTRAWTSQPVVYVGQLLCEAGLMEEAQLSASLAEASASRSLIGESLLSAGLIDVEQLSAALREQRLRRLHHAFTFPPTSRFAFYASTDLIGERPLDVEPADPLPAIWHGLAASPPVDHVHALVESIGLRAVRLINPFETDGFRGAERAAIESLEDGPATLAALAARPGVDASIAELLAYFLITMKLADIIDAPIVTAVPDAPPSRPSLLPQGSTEHVRVSYSPSAPHAGDEPPPSSGGSSPPSSLRPSGPPSSMRPSVPPSTTSSGPLSARPGPPLPRSFAPPEPNPEADNAISQAEMSFMLGDRRQALELVKEALTLSPRMGAGLALLAALEASNVREGQEDKLRAIVKRLDSIIAAEPKCRRGRFYRGRLRKKLGDLEGAIDDFREAVADDPEDVDAGRELKLCERKEREAAKKSVSFLDRLRGK
jgi:hypothetical protein